MTKNDNTRRRGSSTRQAAPATLRRQIATNGEVDYAALLDWWEHRCPAWLHEAGVSPTTAALLSVLPEAAVRELPGRLRFTITPAS